MVLDFSNSKNFLIRVVIYFVVLAIGFRFLGYFIAEQLPGIFENVLHSSANGNFNFDLPSLELVKEWTTNGISDLLSGFFSVAFAGAAEPPVRIAVSSVSMKLYPRPVLATI